MQLATKIFTLSVIGFVLSLVIFFIGTYKSFSDSTELDRKMLAILFLNRDNSAQTFCGLRDYSFTMVAERGGNNQRLLDTYDYARRLTFSNKSKEKISNCSEYEKYLEELPESPRELAIKLVNTDGRSGVSDLIIILIFVLLACLQAPLVLYSFELSRR